MNTKILKPQYEKMAVLLAGGMSTRQAAEELEISHATGYRWAARPDVRGRVQELQSSATREAITALRDVLGEAVGTLAAIMADEEVAPGVRVSAAGRLLEQAIKCIELAEIMERLDRLERKIQDGGIESEE